MLNIDELIITYIILNYQINKRATRVVLCYMITNRVVFEYVISDPFIICVVFGLVNIVANLLLIRSVNTNCHP